MIESESYRLTALDGYEIEVTGQDLANGYIYFGDGQVQSYFPKLPCNTSVRGLYAIEALQ